MRHDPRERRAPVSRSGSLRLLVTLTAAAVFVTIAAPAVAQSSALPQDPAKAESPAAQRTADYIVIDGESNRFADPLPGGGTGVGWLRTSHGTTIAVGAHHFRIADSEWTLVSSAVSLQPHRGLTLGGSARIGAGRADGARFDYRFYEGSVGVRVAPALHFTVADQYFDVGGTHGHLLKPGAQVVFAHRLLTEIDYAKSAGGNLDTETVAARASLIISRITIISGMATGRTAPEIFDVAVGRAAMTSDLRESFAGLQLRVRRADVTLVWSELVVNGAYRGTLSGALKYQIH